MITPKLVQEVLLYVNERLKFKKRLDIKFDREECEACFIEVICKTSKQNPIFGALSERMFRMSEHLLATLENFGMFLGKRNNAYING